MKRFSVIPKSIKSKYSWGDKVPASGIYECSVCSNYEAFKKGEFFSQCQDCINNHREEENKWYVTNEFLYFISKNINIEYDTTSSFQVKVADRITEWAGSMGFVYVHVMWFAWWIAANLGVFGPTFVFDPFPFGLLTMIVSLEAIFLATFIMISQNISNQKNELRAEHEYQINLETEKNVAELLAMMKEMRKDTELKNETIDDIKETIEEIAEHTEDLHEEVIEKVEEKEQKAEPDTEDILDEAGIDSVANEPEVQVVTKPIKKKSKKNRINSKMKSRIIRLKNSKKRNMRKTKTKKK